VPATVLKFTETVPLFFVTDVMVVGTGVADDGRLKYNVPSDLKVK